MNEQKTYTKKMMQKMFITYVCPVCGKEIVRVSFKDYVYRRDGHTFCSWGCMRKYEKDPTQYGMSKRRFKNTPLSSVDNKKSWRKRQNGK